MKTEKQKLLEFYKQIIVLQKKVANSFDTMSKKQKNELVHFLITTSDSFNLKVPFRLYLHNENGVKEYRYITVKYNRVKLSKSNVSSDILELKKVVANKIRSIKSTNTTKIVKKQETTNLTEEEIENSNKRKLFLLQNILLTSNYFTEAIEDAFKSEIFIEDDVIFRGLGFERDDLDNFITIGSIQEGHYSFTSEEDIACKFAKDYIDVSIISGVTVVLVTSNVKILDMQNSFNELKKTNAFYDYSEGSRNQMIEFVDYEHEKIVLDKYLRVDSVEEIDDDFYFVNVSPVRDKE